MRDVLNNVPHDAIWELRDHFWSGRGGLVPDAGPAAVLGGFSILRGGGASAELCFEKEPEGNI